MEGNRPAFTEAKRVLYHECVRTILGDLDHATQMYVYLEISEASLDIDLSLIAVNYRGCFWQSADGQTRKCYPVVAAFQVDYPESQLLTLTHQNYACPTCMAGKSDFGDLLKEHDMRTPAYVSNLYQQARNLEVSRSMKDADDFLQKYGQIYLEVYCYLKIAILLKLASLNINKNLHSSYRASYGISRDAIFMQSLCPICFTRLRRECGNT